MTHEMSARPYAAFRNVAQHVVPVKNTFVHFDDTVEEVPPPPLLRASTCPPTIPNCCCVKEANDWRSATQALCHAMTPAICHPVGPELMPSPVDEEYLIPRSALRYQVEAAKAAGEALCVSEGGDTLTACSWESPNLIKQQGEAQSEGAPRSDKDGDWTATCLGRWNVGPGCLDVLGCRDGCSEGKVHYYADFPTAEAAMPRQEVMGSMAQAPRQVRLGDECATKFPVGIEEDRSFRVVQRLLGPRGTNLRLITAESMGAKVWLCGRGSCLPENPETEDLVQRVLMGPLTLCVSAASGPSFGLAVELVQTLLDAVRAEHSEFLQEETLRKAAMDLQSAL